MRERDVQSKVVGYARSHRVIARKLDFGQGWPDYMFLYQGRIMFIEFKGAGGRVAPLQEYVHSILRKAEFTVHLVDRSEVGCTLIDSFIDVRAAMVDYSDIIKKTVENRK